MYSNYEKISISDLLHFIKKSSTYKLNLPHDAHIPED